MTNQVQAPVAPQKKKKIASLDRRKARSGWFFVLPFVLGFVLVYVPIIYEAIKYSLFTYRVVSGGQVKEFAGWTHYKDALFGTTNFVQTLLTGLGELAFDIPAILIFSLFIAVILNQKMIGRAAFRAIFFLPVVVSTGLMESVLSASYSFAGEGMDVGLESEADKAAGENLAIEGLLMGVFENLGFGAGLVEYIVKAVANISDIINRCGVQILIFLASLQSISPAIYESCEIDGATAWETFWKITFPMVSPMILVNAVYTIIDSFTTDSNSVMRVIDNTYMGTMDGARHISAAMGWMYFLVVLAVVGVVAAVFSAYVFYQRRD